MLNTNELLKTYKKPNLAELLNLFKNYINDIVINIVKESKIYNKNNIRLYYYDEYVLNTNVCENTFATLYIEFDSDKNIKPEIVSEKKSNSKYKSVLKDYYIELSDIRNRLYEEMLNYFDDNNAFWLDKYSIKAISNVQINDEVTKNYQFKIIPCFTYKNNNNVKGIIYYDDTKNLIEIEYPLRSIENFNEKNIETDGSYKKNIIAFKNIYKLSEKVNDFLPSEIFEILLYNLPNNLFKGTLNQSLYRIINNLKNLSLRKFKTLDDQDDAFISKYKSMSLLYSKKVIKIIEKYLTEKLN